MNQETRLSPDTIENTFVFFELSATVSIWYSRRIYIDTRQLSISTKLFKQQWWFLPSYLNCTDGFYQAIKTAVIVSTKLFKQQWRFLPSYLNSSDGFYQAI